MAGNGNGAPSPWVVYKFGGSSVASAGHYRAVGALIAASEAPRLAVVVSAMRGVTDRLLGLLEQAESGAAFDDGLKALEAHQHDVHRELIGAIPESLDNNFEDLHDLLHAVRLARFAGAPVRDLVSGMGELWSAGLLAAHLAEQGREARLVDPREFMLVSRGEMGPEVDWSESARLLAEHAADEGDCWVLPGYVAREPGGRMTTLGRNGSDYSAAIIGRLLGAREIVIWTDVDGVMSADPALVPDALVLDKLSYDEALELAYFGARVIHPKTLAPAIDLQIPIRIRNTFRPDHSGTLIGERDDEEFRIKGITSIDGLALVNIEGAGMIGVPGTARRVFGALQRGAISVVLISQASSEHSICVCVEAGAAPAAVAKLNEEFSSELASGKIQRILPTEEVSILAVVGDSMTGQPGIAARYFTALADAGINVRAIAQGSSERNISAVIDHEDVQRGLRAVHSAFYLSAQTLSVGILGTGHVGGALLDQLAGELDRLRAEAGVDIRIRAIARSKEMVLTDPSIAPADWRAAFEQSAVATDLDALAAHVHADHLPHAVLIDLTASEEVALRHAEWLGRGLNVITANKKANAADYSLYREIRRAAHAAGTRYLYETNVGAGLPVVQTLRDLRQTGDRIESIEGILSGTLAYLFNIFDASRPFSELVRDAWKEGYTEPDPRDDLSGMDVARKLVILAREVGIMLDLGDLEVESLTPPDLAGGGVEDFLKGLAKHDDTMAQRYRAAVERGQVLRFVGRMDRAGRGRIGLVEVPADHVFAQIDLTDNVVRYTTARYDRNPLIVRGPGAGPAVTAAGVFADLLRLCSMLGARI